MAKRDIIINLITKTQGKDLKDLEKNLADVGKQSEKTGGFFKTLSDKLSGFGNNVGKDLTGKLGVAGDAIDDVGGGLGDMSGKAALAGGAIAALGGFIAQGVGKLRDLYDNTRNFNEVAGTTWEEGSRLIAVFDDLRVSSEEGASAVGKLTKTVGTSPEVLAKYGIEIVKAKDGTVDMAATLANVADAFKNTTDPAKRAALGSELFGKSWASMVPVLSKGGTELKKLVAGVDDAQVATAKGAEEQDKMFEATDNLGDAVTGLQVKLAENLIPALAELARGTTEVIGWFDKLQNAVEKLGPSYEEAQEGSKGWKEWLDRIGPASDHVGEATGGFSKKLAEAAQMVRDAHTTLNDLAGGLVNTELRAKDAKDEFKRFEDKTRDLIQAQEDLRTAQLGTEDAGIRLEGAEIRAGDASMELSDKARIAGEAIRVHGADHDIAKVAVEEHRRALLDARSAMNDAAQAAVDNAVKQAEAAGTTLTAAEKTKIYRDELIKLRDGAKDPALVAALDERIGQLAEVAAQAQSAAANLHGLVQAMNDAAGIERNFTGRSSDGTAVTRRATGGPMWPGRSYLVHKDEVIRWNGDGPADVMSAPEAARQGGGWPILSGVSGAGAATVTRDASGNIIHVAAPQTDLTFPGIVKSPLQNGGLSFPVVGASSAGGGSSASGAAFTPTIPGADFPGSTSSGSGGPNFYITIYGYADIKKLVDAIRQYEAARK